MSLIPTAISRKVAEVGLQASKNAPSLLFGAGVVSMVGSTVLACRATLKLEAVLDEAKSDLDMANTVREDVPEKYSEEDRQQDRVVIIVRTTGKILKLYGPAIVVGAVGIACLAKGKNILQTRNEALAAAYVAVDSAFQQYRGRVIEKYGEDEDRELRYGSEEREVWDEEKGKMVKATTVPWEAPSQYARFFDELADCWQRNPEYNLTFLRCQQNYANEKLQAKGYLFLNDVYDALGLERSRAGQVVGWVLDGPNSDGFIDFGIWDGGNPKARDFVNGREGSILLDFNVDGPIEFILGEGENDDMKRLQGGSN